MVKTVDDKKSGAEGWNRELARAMEAEHDQREAVRASDDFINKDDGMWEPNVIQATMHRPRYTFDLITPKMDQIIGEMDKTAFTLRSTPASATASMRNARVIDGLMRHIRNISNFDVWAGVGRQQFLERGLFAYEVTANYQTPMSFDQDLFIRPIFGAEDKVFFDPNSKLPDRSDAEWVHIIDELTVEAYEEKFPKGKKMSVGTDREAPTRDKATDFIAVGRRLWKKRVKKTIVKMSDGSVYEDNADFKKALPTLNASGIVEKGRREVEDVVICSRMYDGGGFLTETEETVFKMLPVSPLYCNFKISDNKILFSSFVKRLMDFNRVFNYAKSREIEEGALAARRKMWGTPEQRVGHDETLSKLNVSPDPWQDYNHIDGVPPPFESGGAQINPGLQVVSADMREGMKESAGLFDSSIGDNPGFQSGVAVNSMIDRGNNGTSKHFESLRLCYTHIGKIITGAMPKIYDATRVVRILGEDGHAEMTTINKPVVDQKTGEVIFLNDLTVGDYDVICDIGPAFKNRQDESSKMFTEVAKVYPEIMQLGGDVFLGNLGQPGMDIVARRARQMQIKSGIVPREEMSDEEIAMFEKEQEAAKNKGPSLEELTLQIQQTEAQTAMMTQQNKQTENQIKLKDLDVKAIGMREKIQSDMAQSGAAIDQDQQRIDLDVRKQEFEEWFKQQRLSLQEQQQQQQEWLNRQKLQIEESKVTLQKLQAAHNAAAADDDVEYQRGRDAKADERESEDKQQK